ncbi:flavodoxin [Campylobacter blaseri]|uniref:Flavodoxin n=1 Tax=Campylobacter blaseri TaxID=2042961 RepID=A0A2P8R2K6_9BACT|nr:flavodoxin domain-containing protein [Campylobacter blaseri]PSM52735.1 flavodoxin [Campylobacter blaseri]PSM54383.1 flavodoxin [Campylobacter blaseri]QKF86039.1 flavodoxin [Campylobacter blaseri]
MEKIAIFFGSSSGNTKEVSEFIAKKLDADIFDIKDAKVADFDKYTKFILATSSYGFGDLQDDWFENLELLDEINFKEKTVALVGIGGLARHADSFCSALVDFLPKIKGVNFIGQTELDGYEIKKSSAFINGKFIGLCVDFKGDKNWQTRVEKWCKSVKESF